MGDIQDQSIIQASDGWDGRSIVVKTEISHYAPKQGHVDEAASGYRRNNYTNNYQNGAIANGVPPEQQLPDSSNNDDDGNTLPPPPQCHCGLASTRLLSRSERNPNRWFYKCPKYKEDTTQCRFFQWEDEMGSKSPAPPPNVRRRVGNYTTSPPAGAAAAAGPGTWNGKALGDMATQPGVSADVVKSPTGQAGGYNAYSAPWAPPAAVAGGIDTTQDTCYKCGQPGHWSRDCTNPPKQQQGYQTAIGSGGGGAAGYYNNNTYGGGAASAGGGYDAGGGGATRGGTCFKCGEEGHWSRDCPNAGKAGGGGGGYGGGGGGATRGGQCFKCGETGHWSRDCPNAGDGGGGYGGGYGGGCSGYGAGGNSYAGSKRRYDGGGNGYGGGGGASGSCFKCGESGHWSKDCPNK